MREPETNRIDSRNGAGSDAVRRYREEDKCVLNAMKVMGILLFIFTIFSFMFSFSIVHYEMSSPSFNLGDLEDQMFGDFEPLDMLESVDVIEEGTNNLFGGFLSPGFHRQSCLSRYRSGLYRNPPSHYPSSYLISKIRIYESLHKRCGPHTEPYRKALGRLSSRNQSGPSDCDYIVWISNGELGNNILTLASAFLYALLTNRVLLVDRGNDISHLFCEPFPETSWLLPYDFPLTSQFIEFNQKSNKSYGNMLKNHVFENISDARISSYLYFHLGHDYDDEDKLFFCDQDQSFFEKFPWLIIKTDNYFIPSLFLIPSFEQELSNLFPEKDTVFHFLGRYLFHPANGIWDLITTYYYKQYPQKLAIYEKIGIDIRGFNTEVISKQQVFDQIFSCVSKNGILPEISKQDYNTDSYETKAVLVTSSDSWYFEQLKDIYLKNPTYPDKVISFFQPIHVEYQDTDNIMHKMNEWAEIYLLSLTDKLITSSWSTFGYVAQGLGGLRPWILYKPNDPMAHDSPYCHRAISMEPCFHSPPNYDCKKKIKVDAGLIVPHVRHCEDMSLGIKLVGNGLVRIDR